MITLYSSTISGIYESQIPLSFSTIQIIPSVSNPQYFSRSARTFFRSSSAASTLIRTK
jgi:hypothetical protein